MRDGSDDSPEVAARVRIPLGLLHRATHFLERRHRFERDVAGYTPDMTDKAKQSKDESAVRDALAAFNAEDVVEDPGRPAPEKPEESPAADSDVPPPG